MSSQQTFITGKDAALETSIARFQQQLETIGFNIEQASWLNPVPNVWSVHIHDRDCPQCFTNGKGTTKNAALASALGEFLERLSCNYFFADFYLGEQIANSDFVHYPNEKWFELTDNQELPEGLLDQRLLDVYQAEQPLEANALIDLQSDNFERGICALPFTRQADQATVYIPVNIIGNLYVSNGMSAGNSREETRVQALSEILERYVKNQVLIDSLSLPEIPAEVLARYPLIEQAMSSIEAEGFPLYAFDASLGGEFPVICVVLFNPANGTCFASFGAHPNFGVALERSVTELLQGRSLQELDVFLAPTFDNDQVADYTNLETHFTDSSGLVSWDLFSTQVDFPFVEWDFSGTTSEEFAQLLKIIQQQGSDAYIADYQHLGVDACRILVPGMSEIYPIEDLELANNNMGQDLRELVLSLAASDWEEEEYLELIDALTKEGFDDFMPIAELIGVVPTPNSVLAGLRIGELKSMLALAGGDFEAAMEWTEWTLSFNSTVFSVERQNYYRCLQTLLSFQLDGVERDFNDYRVAFNRLYGETTVQQVSQVLNGTQRFVGLESVDNNLSQLPAHQRLLEAYQKLQRAKV